TANRTGIGKLFMGFLEGSRPVRIPTGDSGSDLESVSKDGKKIIYSTAKDESDLWGVKVNSPVAFQVTNKVGVELWPDVSRDGERIVFQATQIESLGQKLDDCAIFSKPVALQGQPLKLAEPGFAPQWSPDGSQVAFLRVSNSQFDLWTVSVADRQLRQLTAGGILFGGFGLLPY